MGIEVRWTWDRSAGLYAVEGDGDGVEVRVRTANLAYASELTRLLLQSTPQAFVPPPELTPEQEARMAAANPPEPIDVLNVDKVAFAGGEG